MSFRGLSLLLLVAASVAHGLSLPPGFDMREIKYLLSVVDPPSCKCAPPTACEVPIPNAHFVGFRCNGYEKRFCCKRKNKANTSSRLKLVPDLVLKEKIMQGLDLVEKQGAEGAKETIEKELKEILIEEVRRETSNDDRDKVETTTEVVAETELNAEDGNCSCVESSKCSSNRMDFSFGRSCGFGFVRCCGGGGGEGEAKKTEEDVFELEIVEDKDRFIIGDGNSPRLDTEYKKEERVNKPATSLGEEMVPKKNFTRHSRPDVLKVLPPRSSSEEEGFSGPRTGGPLIAKPTIEVSGANSRFIISNKASGVANKEDEYAKYVKFLHYQNLLRQRQMEAARRRMQQSQQQGAMGYFYSMADNVASWFKF
jgi:hypothetical protein